MKIQYLLIAAIALFIFACGDSGVSNSGGGNSSSSGTSEGSSSDDGVSSNSETACQGQNCCNGAEFDTSTHFCSEDQLYPKCDNKVYDPYEVGCFEGKTYPRCSLEKTRGTCVHESLLRCRQEGEGENKIVKPIPGMTCESNGKITGHTLDPRDGGKKYSIVQIGNQIWLAENLKTDASLAAAGAATNDKCYEDTPAKCDEIGRLYDWATAMELPLACNGTNQSCPQKSGAALWGGLCPPTFAISRTEDWDALIEYAGGAAIAGGRLKSTSGWSNNGNGTDSYGFNAKPNGYYTGLETKPFNDSDSRAIWWTESQLISEAYYTTIISSDTEVKTNFQSKGWYYAAVRCLHYF